MPEGAHARDKAPPDGEEFPMSSSPDKPGITAPAR